MLYDTECSVSNAQGCCERYVVARCRPKRQDACRKELQVRHSTTAGEADVAYGTVSCGSDECRCCLWRACLRTRSCAGLGKDLSATQSTGQGALKSFSWSEVSRWKLGSKSIESTMRNRDLDRLVPHRRKSTARKQSLVRSPKIVIRRVLHAGICGRTCEERPIEAQ